jgi:hypothetical protein
MKNLLEGRHLDFGKWLGRLVILGVVLLAGWYLYMVKNQVWFAVTTPNAVSACMEGYNGEHGEADRRFELKQRSEIISPLPSESPKE